MLLAGEELKAIADQPSASVRGCPSAWHPLQSTGGGVAEDQRGAWSRERNGEAAVCHALIMPLIMDHITRK